MGKRMVIYKTKQKTPQTHTQRHRQHNMQNCVTCIIYTDLFVIYFSNLLPIFIWTLSM